MNNQSSWLTTGLINLLKKKKKKKLGGILNKLAQLAVEVRLDQVKLLLKMILYNGGSRWADGGGGLRIIAQCHSILLYRRQIS